LIWDHNCLVVLLTVFKFEVSLSGTAKDSFDSSAVIGPVWAAFMHFFLTRITVPMIMATPTRLPTTAPTMTPIFDYAVVSVAGVNVVPSVLTTLTVVDEPTTLPSPLVSMLVMVVWMVSAS